MSSLLEHADVLHEWGIEPVPETHRRLGLFDVAILWGDLGIGLLVLVTGGFLAGMSLAQASVAIVIGSLIGVGLLSVVASAGAVHGLPTMVLFRPVLGLRGSWLPSVLNVLQLVGWTAVELWAMSFVADLVSERVFGFSARGLWLAIAAVVCTGLAWWGPVAVTRVWMERFAAWIVAGIALIVTILVVTAPDRSVLASASGALPMGAAIDLVIAMPISWLPLVADYTRFATSRRAGSWGTFIGYFVANVWFYLLGFAIIGTTGQIPASPQTIAAGILSLAGGTIAGALFLVSILAVETDEAFADIYSGAVSLQNIWPNAPQRALVGVVGALGAALAWWLTMERYESFLFLIGSFFVPLFGVFIADHFVNRRGRITVPEVDRDGGLYWFRGGIRPSMLLAWAAGFLAYQWVTPVGPDWWIDAVVSTLGDPLAAGATWLPGSIPGFAVAFLLALRPLSSAPTSTEERQQ